MKTIEERVRAGIQVVVHATFSPPVAHPREPSRTITYLQSNNPQQTDSYCEQMEWDFGRRMLLVNSVGYPCATRLLFAPGVVSDTPAPPKAVEEPAVDDEAEGGAPAPTWTASEPDFPPAPTEALQPGVTVTYKVADAAGKVVAEVTQAAEAVPVKGKQGKKSWQSKLSGLASGGQSGTGG